MGVWRIVLLAPVLWLDAQQTGAGEDVRATMERAVAEQRASVEVQRRAVRRQMGAEMAGDAFFTAPWVQAVVVASISAGGCPPVPEERIESLIEQVSSREGITPDLLRAVIRKESAFLPCAVSPKGAQGLMQLMPATSAGFGVQDPFDPEQNVTAGAKFLRQLLVRYGGDLALTLGAYNAGPARVDALGRLPPFDETRGYVSDILGVLGVGCGVGSQTRCGTPGPRFPVATTPLPP